MSLRDIFCQDRAIGILQRGLAVSRPAHAYIFAGLEGVGKYKTAHQWAKLLLCRSPVCSTPALGGDRAPKREESCLGAEPSRGRLVGVPNAELCVGGPRDLDTSEPGQSGPFADSCGSCQSCTLLEAGSHPDYADVYKELLEYTKEGKGKKTPLDLPIDVIREFLIEQVAIRPALAQRRVFVLSEAEKLNANSQNALLKVLEEPPPHCTIILLCTRLEQLLPTTRSRCQIIRFGPVEEDRITAQLAGMGLGSQEAVFFARLAQGSLGLACQWARLELDGTGLFEIKRGIITSLAEYKLADALGLAERILENAKRIAAGWSDLDKATSKSDLTRRATRTLIQIVLSALRDVTIAQVAAERPLINSDQPEQIARLARRLDPEPALEAVGETYEMLRWLEANVNERLIFERLLLRLARATIMAAPS